jgi:outer membrane protein OmpA-like peptidoglycan-associated protein
MKGLKRLLCTVPAVAAIAWGAACSGSKSSEGAGCHYETWHGQCALQGVHTIRTIERFPTSYVVIETMFEPRQVEGAFSPPPFRKQDLISAEYEVAFTEHVKQSPVVDCSVGTPVGDPCAPTMVANAPEFLPPNAGPAGPVGCAKIEQSSGATVPPSVKLPGPFQFEQGSSVETPEVVQLVAEAARQMKQDPRIECVAIKGMSAPGEPFTLANERAQAVRKLLEARGIDHARVTVFEAVAPAYTASPDDQPVLSEHRRVHLSVVVYSAQ